MMLREREEKISLVEALLHRSNEIANIFFRPFEPNQNIFRRSESAETNVRSIHFSSILLQLFGDHQVQIVTQLFRLLFDKIDRLFGVGGDLFLDCVAMREKRTCFHGQGIWTNDWRNRKTETDRSLPLQSSVDLAKSFSSVCVVSTNSFR